MKIKTKEKLAKFLDEENLDSYKISKFIDLKSFMPSFRLIKDNLNVVIGLDVAIDAKNANLLSNEQWLKLDGVKQEI